MRNDHVMSVFRRDVLCLLETGFYAVAGGLLVAQLFVADGPLGLAQTVPALLGEALLGLAATFSAPLTRLSSGYQDVDSRSTGDVLSFQRSRSRPSSLDRGQRRAA